MLYSSMNLTSANRARHSSMLQTFINNSECTDLVTSQKVDFNSLWGRLGPRYGRRSADGIVLQLKQPDVYKTLSRRNNAVIKFLFFENDPKEMKKQLNEIQITLKCGEKRIGPKVFGSYRFDLLPANRRNFSAKFTSLVGEPNLFSGSFVNKGFVGCYAMILEDLYNNPVARVTKGWNLYDFAIAASQGEDGITKLPIQKFKNKFLQMRKLGIWHADMHTNNIVVQRIGPVRDQHYEIRVFDFGRSMDLGRNLSGLNENATLRSVGLYQNIGGRWLLNPYNYPRLANKNAYLDVMKLFRFVQARGGQALGTSGSMRRAISSQGRRNLNAASAARRPPPPLPTPPQPQRPSRQQTPPTPPPARPSSSKLRAAENARRNAAARRKAAARRRTAESEARRFVESVERRAAALKAAEAAETPRRRAERRRAVLEKIIRIRRGGAAYQPLFGPPIQIPVFPTASEQIVAASLNKRAAKAAQSLERKRNEERLARNREAIMKNLRNKKIETIKKAILNKYNKYTEQNKSAQRGWKSWGKQMAGFKNNLYTERIKELYEIASTRPNAKRVLDELLTTHNPRLHVPVRKMPKADFENLKTNLKQMHNNFVFSMPNGRQFKL